MAGPVKEIAHFDEPEVFGFQPKRKTTVQIADDLLFASNFKKVMGGKKPQINKASLLAAFRDKIDVRISSQSN